METNCGLEHKESRIGAWVTGGVLVCWDCHTKIPQAGRLTEKEIGLTVLHLEFWRLELTAVEASHCRRARLPPKAWGETFLASFSFWYLLVILGIP